jgi:phenylpropionate dioxygenase-like ring-hydroxylating dioxygenase large terminal subunit
MTELALSSLRAHWFAACPSRALRRRPLARTVLGVPIVLFRTGDGVRPLLDRCPHRNRALSDGALCGDSLRCAYHGWRFDGEGRCVEVPGLPGAADRPSRRAGAFPVAERDGIAWVLLAGEPGATRFPLHALAHPAGAAFDRVLWTLRLQASLTDALENLLDAAHPHFVHRGLLRSARRRPTEVTVRRDAHGASAEYRGDGASAGWLSRLLEGERALTVASYLAPAVARLEYHGPRGPRFVVSVAFTPVDERTCDVHAVVATPRTVVPAFVKHAVLRALFAPVIRQDAAALARQRWNLERFGEPSFVSTPLDVMRPHIVSLLHGGANGAAANGVPEQRIVLDL